MFWGKKFVGWITVIGITLVISLIVFRPVILNHQIPFPANLLPSFYEPWMSYPLKDYPNGPPNKPIGFDAVRNIYPHRDLATDIIKHGELPLWNPYNFSGNVLLGQYDPAMFHPMSWLFLLLPTIQVWTIIIFIVPILAAVGMYGFLQCLGVTKSAGVFGAVVFAFSGFIIMWWEETYVASYTAISLPYLLWAIESFRKQSGRVRWVLMIVIFSISILSGWFQFTLYSWLFALIFLIFRKPSVKVFLFVAIAAVLAGLISGIHLLPGLETFLQSARGSTDAKYLFDLYLLPLTRIVTFLAPDYWGNPGTYHYFGGGFFYERILYIGIAPFLLVLYELFVWKKHIAEESFFTVAFFVAVSLGFSLPTSWFFLYTLHLPLLSVIIPSRIFFLSTVAGSVLAAFAIDRYLKKFDTLPLAVVSFISIVMISAGWGYAMYAKHQVATAGIKKIIDQFIPYATVSFRNLYLPTFVLGTVIILLWLGILNHKFKTFCFILIFLITLGHAVFFAQKYLYFSDPRLLFPKTPVISKLQETSGTDRFWTMEQGNIQSNFQTQFRLFSPEGYDSFFIRRYGELIDAAKHKGILQKDIPRADATIASTDTFTDILADPFRVKILNLTGVKYILRKNVPERNGPVDVGADPSLKLIWTDDVYQIFHYQDAYPRVFLTTDFIVETEPQKILDRMFSADMDLRKAIVLEEWPQGIVKASPSGQLAATIISYMPNTVNIQTQVDKPAILFLSDNDYPGWGARVDGKSVKLYRADYTFRAVVVPEGKHTVVFSFRPRSVQVGFILSALGLFSTFLVVRKLKNMV